VFHFAAITALPVCQNYPRHALDVNVAGVASVMEYSRIAGVRRFIFASTSAVYEENHEPVFTETLTVSPHLIYSLSKYQIEQLVFANAFAYDLDVVVLRFFNVYGPHQDFRRLSPPLASYVVRELVNGRVPIFHSNGEQSRDYIFVTDLMDLAIRAMSSPNAKGQIFNVASGRSYSVNEMYLIVAKQLNSNIRPVYHEAVDFWKAYPEMFSGAKPLNVSILVKEVNKRSLGSNEKARNLLGWEPKVTMEQGLSAMIDYVRKRNAGASKVRTSWD